MGQLYPGVVGNFSSTGFFKLCLSFSPATAVPLASAYFTFCVVSKSLWDSVVRSPRFSISGVVGCC